jgi:hypothetical protein
MHRFKTHIKREYTGNRSVTFTILARGLPDNSALDIRSNQLAISGKLLKDVFEPVVSEVLTLVIA